jgi:transposase
MAKSKRYSKEYKLEAARLVVEHGYTFKEAAKRLGATDGSIRQWVQTFRQSGQLSSSGTALSDTADELRRLRKENKRLQLETEILKKAAAYFARESL